jgi:uncharacterized protein (DUF58 family)
MSARRLRLTRRGWLLLGAGLLAATSGVLIGVTILVQVGLLLLLTVALCVALLAVEAHHQERGGLVLERRVVPHPVSVGQVATVEVSISGGGSVDRLQIAERAARELSGGAPLRARVRRDRGRLALTYRITPDARGRWSVGPLQVRRRDLFGTAEWSGPLGDGLLVAVRPAVTALPVRTSAMSSDMDRAASGTRSPSADDSLLRPYRTGDDLRRVHWRSSARRGELVVRQDERSGRRPASVLLDLAQHGPTGEWSIRLAASVAVAMVEAGHHVRLLGGDVLDSGVVHHRPDVGGVAVGGLLDQTVDLSLPSTPDERDAWLRTAVDTLHADAGGAELVLAVVGALSPQALGALARTGETTHGWAMVRACEDGTGTVHPDARRTAERLRRAGWTFCLVHPGEDLAGCWTRLLAADDRLLVAR